MKTIGIAAGGRVVGREMWCATRMLVFVNVLVTREVRSRAQERASDGKCGARPKLVRTPCGTLLIGYFFCVAIAIF
jgi:hypothetical protein